MTGEVVCGYRLLRELGTRALPAYAALAPKPKKAGDALCVVEQLVRGAGISAEAAAGFLRDAKRLSQLHHPNVIRVRDVVVATNTVLLVSDWVEGEALSEVQATARRAGIPVPFLAALRVLVDVLEGLSAIHDLRDARREPMNLVHAEVSPRNVIVALDGHAVLAHPLRSPGATAKRPPPEVAGYLAPEVLLGDQALDQRADVFGAGVMLWEALMGRRMIPEGEDVGEIVLRHLGGRIEAPLPPADAPWSTLLVATAKKATSPDPSVRFANASSMLSEVRRAMGPRLPAKSVVASIVETTAGDHVRQRARALAPDAPMIPRRTVPLDAEESPVSIPIEHEPLVDAQTPAAPPASTRASAGPPSASPPTPTTSSPPASDPISADLLEVVDAAVPPDRPSRPKPPPPPLRPRAKATDPHPAPSAPPGPAPLPTARVSNPSTTDLGPVALIATADAAPPTPESSRTRLAVVAACAVGVAVLAWMALHRGPSGSASTEAPAPSSTVSSADAPTPRASAEVVVAPESPPHPVASVATPPEQPAAPTPAPSPPASPTSREAAPFPSAPPTPAATPPPAGASPHPKKRVYDPMGI